MREPHIERIEGQRTLVVENTPPLPQKMPDLLAAMERTGVTYRADFSLRGTSAACERRDHPFKKFREGRHFGTDGVLRDLRLDMCPDCGAVRVTDITPDRLPGLPTGTAGPARRRLTLGWYSGARRNSREYR